MLTPVSIQKCYIILKHGVQRLVLKNKTQTKHHHNNRVQLTTYSNNRNVNFKLRTTHVLYNSEHLYLL